MLVMTVNLQYIVQAYEAFGNLRIFDRFFNKIYCVADEFL